jgi:CBS domain-containing protein
MICPDCQFDNIPGTDTCEACGQPMIHMDASGSELEESISRHQVEVLCPSLPVCIPPTLTVREAVAEMVQRKIGCVIVEENDELVGIFTERDVLNKITPDLSTLDRPVADFMTRAPETLTRRDSIAYGLHAMDLGGYRHLPVVNSSKKTRGVVSVRDILRFLCIRFAKLRS